MPLIELDTIIKEYAETIKDKYPDLSYEQIEAICKAPFWFTKSQIERSDMPVVHIKFFGKFRVFKGHIQKKIIVNDKSLEKNSISLEEHTAVDSFLKKKLKEVIEYESKNDNKKDKD